MKILLHVPGELGGQVELRQADVLPVAGLHPACDRVGERAHLLVDLLVHEVAVFALLGGDRVPGDSLELHLHGFSVESLHLHAVPGHHSHLA